MKPAFTTPKSLKELKKVHALKPQLRMKIKLIVTNLMKLMKILEGKKPIKLLNFKLQSKRQITSILQLTIYRNSNFKQSQNLTMAFLLIGPMIGLLKSVNNLYLRNKSIPSKIIRQSTLRLLNLRIDSTKCLFRLW